MGDSCPPEPPSCGSAAAGRQAGGGNMALPLPQPPAQCAAAGRPHGLSHCRHSVLLRLRQQQLPVDPVSSQRTLAPHLRQSGSAQARHHRVRLLDGLRHHAAQHALGRGHVEVEAGGGAEQPAGHQPHLLLQEGSQLLQLRGVAGHAWAGWGDWRHMMSALLHRAHGPRLESTWGESSQRCRKL